VTGSFHGDPFTLTRTGVIFSPSDVNFDSSLELTGELGALTGSKFGAATITGVHFAGTVTQAQKTARIGQVESASSLQPNFAVRRTLHVRPGDTVRLRVTLARADGTTGVTAMSLDLPVAFHGGALRVRGGVPPEGCPFCAFGETFRTTAKSFAQLVAEFQNGEHANDLIAGVGKAKATVSKANQILGSKVVNLVIG
jgi:hypothetical protein